MKSLDIVILGGTGFVGRTLVKRLSRDRHRLRVISRNCAAHDNLLREPGVRYVDVDEYDADQLADAIRGADAVINLVGILNERCRDGSGFRRAHVELVGALIDACRKAGVSRLLQMSALNAGRGRSHYLKTRGEAETMLRESGLDWTLFQPSVIFGPGDGLFCRFARLLRIFPLMPLACAKAKFAPVHVGDVVEAFARALQRRDSLRQSYELYGPRVLTLREIVERTAEGLGLKRWVVPLPDALGRLQAALLDFVPGKPFSSDNFLSLKVDSLGGIDGLFRLGIHPRDPADFVAGLVDRSARQRRMDRDRARA